LSDLQEISLVGVIAALSQSLLREQ
jgi:hypothetical protein